MGGKLTKNDTENMLFYNASGNRIVMITTTKIY